MARQFDAARRTALVEQTLDVLRARGVGRLTMSELATALGVKRPTLYFYFRDLSGLLLAAVEEVYRSVRDAHRRRGWRRSSTRSRRSASWPAPPSSTSASAATW
jgi:AcrR family transcriptional regulator